MEACLHKIYRSEDIAGLVDILKMLLCNSVSELKLRTSAVYVV